MGGSRPDPDRRRFLTVLGGGTVVALTGCRGDDTTAPPTSTTTAPTPDTLPPVDFGPPQGTPPFDLGVASGDPDSSSVILWTHIDRDPAVGASVTVEVALDETFTAIVQRATVTVDPAAAMTVRVLATDLAPDTAYWYRFAADGHLSPAARTRTAPAPGRTPTSVRVGHLSCQRYSSGYWEALADVADQAPDVVVHCGDYVYESDRGGTRPVDEPAPTDLEGYRALWRRYKREPELQAAHAVAPWLMVWDDHEVEDNYQGSSPGGSGPDDAAHPSFLDQRAAAYRAWWEHTPTRVAAPDGPTLPIHRVVDWGGLTRFVLLDTRQYRDDQPCEGTLGADLGPRCGASDTVTMLGADQETFLAEAAHGHDGVWTTVVQQVVVHQWRLLGGNVVWNLDQWDGYPAARRRFVETLAEAPGPVVLTGDVHSSWVADLRVDFDDTTSSPVATEFVGPGVSSSAPSLLGQAGAALVRSSDHIHWAETRRRGWVLHTISADRWHAEYRLVEDASEPDSPVTVASSWTVSPDDPVPQPA